MDIGAAAIKQVITDGPQKPNYTIDQIVEVDD
jgi:hypothetical protein